MKELSVIHALANMPKKEVEEFLKDDFRDISEIFDVVADETEKKYVDFMYRLFKSIEEIEAKEMNESGLVKVLHSQGEPLYQKSGMLSDLIKSVGEENLQRVINIPKLDFTKYVVRRDN